ncbi:MAG TPA: hypothetical protein GX714_15760 [Chloroflexi bacterium]|jgi:hypothetical protein|nr:hypothetical protein [Chloroflexota bacterium]
MDTNHEAALWLTLLNTSHVKRQVAKRVIHRWCVAEGQPLAALFDLGAAEVAEQLGLSPAEATQVLAAGLDVAVQQAALTRLAASGIGVITRVDAAYPDLLTERLPEERLPYYLFYRGDLDNLTQPGVALLGGAQPAEDALAQVSALASALADEGHLLVGGYDRGIDRQALDDARGAGAPITLVLPAGIETMEAVLQRLAPRGAVDRVLALSPYAPTVPYSDWLAAARMSLIGALAEVLVVVAPDKEPDAMGDLRDLFVSPTAAAAHRALAWTGDHGPATRAWIDAGAQPFSGAEAGLAHILAHFGAVPAEAAGEADIDALPGVEPIVFHDADSAIEALEQTGRVPEALARRLREANWDDDWHND